MHSPSSKGISPHSDQALRRIFPPALVAAVAFAASSCVLPGLEPARPRPTAEPGAPTSALSPYARGLVDAWKPSLPRLEPINEYAIELHLADDMLHYTGQQVIHYKNEETAPLEDIKFYLFPNVLGGALTITQAIIDGQEAAIALGSGGLILTLDLAAPLPPGAAAEIELAYSGRIADEASRNYGVQAYADDVLALAHFYPMLAVYDATGWNTTTPSPAGDLTYADAALFKVEVEAPADLVLVASGIEVERRQSDAGRQIVNFAAGPARDFYLAASRGFGVETADFGETSIRLYATVGERQARAAVLTFVRRALQVMGARFGEYPYTELDIVFTPTAALGIEYPGVVVLAERILDTDDPRLEATIAHEVAHQWFYNLVGNDQLDEPWLDESVAQFATQRYFADAYGEPAGRSFQAHLEQRWASVGGADIPVGLPVAAYSGREYGAIVYGRGALFLNALEGTFGDEELAAFMRRYVQDYAWQEATAADFQRAAEESCQCDLRGLFEEWIY